MSETRNEPRRSWLWGIVLLLLLMISTGLYGARKSYARLAKVQSLQKELFSEASKSLPAEEKKQKFEQMRTEMKNLSPDQRTELFAAGQKQAKERMDQYFAMPVKEKQKFLDDEINRIEQQKKQTAANGFSGQPGFGPRPGGNGPGNTKGPGGTTRTPEEIEKRRKEMLSHTTPEQRATRDQMRAQSDRFRTDLNHRLQQRGLPQLPSGGRSGPRE